MTNTYTTYRVYTDGGSRGNPGNAAYGFVVYKNGQKIFEEGREIGVNTNNIAEYSGVVESLRWLTKNIPEENKTIEFYLDSQLVANQMMGTFKIKNEKLQKMFDEAKKLEQILNIPIAYKGIPREENKEADRMVNRALDHLV